MSLRHPVVSDSMLGLDVEYRGAQSNFIRCKWQIKIMWETREIALKKVTDKTSMVMLSREQTFDTFKTVCSGVELATLLRIA